jgi:hypothetical protein
MIRWTGVAVCDVAPPTLEFVAACLLLRVDPLNRRLDDLACGRRRRLAPQRVTDALALWRGAPLSRLAYRSFAQREIARLEELHLAALEARIEAELKLGCDGNIVSELKALVREHPLRERLRGQLMLALYRSGRQSEAPAGLPGRASHARERTRARAGPAATGARAQDPQPGGDARGSLTGCRHVVAAPGRAPDRARRSRPARRRDRGGPRRAHLGRWREEPHFVTRIDPPRARSAP